MATVRARPTPLLVVCILCIILGLMGILGGVLSVVGAFATPGLIDMQTSMMSGAGMPPEMHDAFVEYAEEIQAIQTDRLALLISLGVVNFVLSALLLVGSIRCIKWNPSGPALLAGACAASVIYQIAATAVGIEVQVETADAMDRYMGAVAEMGPGPNPLSGMGQAMGVFGIVIAIGWGLLLESVYVFGFVYLRREKTRALFDPARAAGPASQNARNA